MQNIKITFEITSPFCEKFNDGALEISVSDNELCALAHYDFDPRPLKLSAKIDTGSRVELIFLDYRIELYVNSVLVDEEWPCGTRLFDIKDINSPSIIASEYFLQDKIEPCVIGTFENAQGWYPKNGVFVGDCMPYVRNNEYHVLYLKDRHHHKSKWGMGAHQWEHISTKDFKIWSIHPMAVPITSKDEGSICTGSWISYQGAEHLYYTIRRANQPAIITRSISYDGYHFTKDADFGFFVSEKYNSQVARDPKVFFGADGQYHMILTTVLVKENKGALAHYVSSDLEKWHECKEPIYTVENSDHPECPDYFKFQGKYYLVFSIRGRARYLVSSKPFEDFEVIDDTLIPCAGVPKCAEWNGILVFTGFEPIDGYAGKMTFKAARADKNGALIFEEL